MLGKQLKEDNQLLPQSAKTQLLLPDQPQTVKGLAIYTAKATSQILPNK